MVDKSKKLNLLIEQNEIWYKYMCARDLVNEKSQKNNFAKISAFFLKINKVQGQFKHKYSLFHKICS